MMSGGAGEIAGSLPRFRNQPHVRLCGEELGEPAPEDGVIVDG
jgi:hypothetical protein